MGHIKKGLVVQNNTYMSVQRSLDQIAKSIVKVESTLSDIAEKIEQPKKKQGTQNERKKTKADK